MIRLLSFMYHSMCPDFILCNKKKKDMGVHATQLGQKGWEFLGFFQCRTFFWGVGVGRGGRV